MGGVGIPNGIRRRLTIQAKEDAAVKSL